MTHLTIRSYEWPEVRPGDDVTALLVGTVDDLADLDIVVVNSKVVSKAEGRYVEGSVDDAVAADSVRVVARRGRLRITESAHGVVQANAGIDHSNVRPGRHLRLPADSDESARRVRAGVLAATGRNVGVVISDTMGRAWRTGQVDQAIGCAGVVVSDDLARVVDPYGNQLEVTMPAVADELASAADLVKGKLSGRPLAVVRGLGSYVLPVGADGMGAVSLNRPSEANLFGWGARDAVLAAVRRDPDEIGHFSIPDPADFDAATEALGEPPGGVEIEATDGAYAIRGDAFGVGRMSERLLTILAAYRTEADVTSHLLDSARVEVIVRPRVAYTR